MEWKRQELHIPPAKLKYENAPGLFYHPQQYFWPTMKGTTPYRKAFSTLELWLPHRNLKSGKIYWFTQDDALDHRLQDFFDERAKEQAFFVPFEVIATMKCIQSQNRQFDQHWSSLAKMVLITIVALVAVRFVLPPDSILGGIGITLTLLSFVLILLFALYTFIFATVLLLNQTRFRFNWLFGGLDKRIADSQTSRQTGEET